ncbi:MAG: Co2+/Mg2+ efflux protein ApaG [Sneathiella sp.]|nr:Co2+/Mg2+ efflux protein ApaG [Sneathiella sp.]
MTWDNAYRKITQGIEVSVVPTFQADRSQPENNLYIWAYHIRIENQSDEIVTLRQRCWYITDATGHTEVVRGAGVVGEQPRLTPGDHFEYSSGTPLSTPSGIMVGSYDLEKESGGWLTVEVPAFSLDSPHEQARIN